MSQNAAAPFGAFTQSRTKMTLPKAGETPVKKVLTFLTICGIIRVSFNDILYLGGILL